MKVTSRGLCGLAFMVSAGTHNMLYAEEIFPSNDFFWGGTNHTQWENDSGRFIGGLAVRGTLLSSPCTLETNEVVLPASSSSTATRYLLKLNLVGCGEGEEAINMSSAVSVFAALGLRSALFSDEGAVGEHQLQEQSWMKLKSGANQLTYILNEQQLASAGMGGIEEVKNRTAPSQLPYASNRILRLRMNYE